MRKIQFILLTILMTGCESCEKDCTGALADLLFNAISSNKQSNNGEIVINLDESIQFTSKVLNEFAEGNCRDVTAKADSSKLKAILSILDTAGDVVGTLDTLYGVDELNPGAIDDVLTQVTFFQEGYYELGFDLDAQNKVKERDESNNAADVFKALWELFQVIIGNGKTIPQSQNIIFNEKTNHYMIKVGDGEADAKYLNNALKSGDFSDFARFN